MEKFHDTLILYYYLKFMHKFLPPKRLPVVFLLLFLTTIFLITVGAYTYFKPQENTNSENTNSENTNSDIAMQRKYWKEKIKQMGTQKAYDLFKIENGQTTPQRQHLYTHIFGELLYEADGIKGIVVCDSTFFFGCYHSFFGRAISQGNDKIVKDLNEECIKKHGPLGTGCQHGIGHGLMEYFGSSRLDKALEACLKIQNLTYLGCSSGVFMEFNSPTIIGDEKVLMQRRDFDKNNPFYPCETIKQYKKSCYFELGQWLSKNPALDLRGRGSLCQTIKNEDDRYSCFMGIGNTIGPDANYARGESIANCKKMPNAEGQTLCLAGLAWSFYANPDTRNDYQTICADLEADKKQVCLERGELTKDKIIL